MTMANKVVSFKNGTNVLLLNGTVYYKDKTFADIVCMYADLTGVVFTNGEYVYEIRENGKRGVKNICVIGMGKITCVSRSGGRILVGTAGGYTAVQAGDALDGVAVKAGIKVVGITTYIEEYVAIAYENGWIEVVHLHGRPVYTHKASSTVTDMFMMKTEVTALLADGRIIRVDRDSYDVVATHAAAMYQGASGTYWCSEHGGCYIEGELISEIKATGIATDGNSIWVCTDPGSVVNSRGFEMEVMGFVVAATQI